MSPSLVLLLLLGQSPLSLQSPRYEVHLNLVEFSILHSAAAAGVEQYGGTADFDVRLERDGEQLAWTVTIEDPRLIKVWTYWMNEKTADIVNATDFSELTGESEVALRTAQAVNAKLAQARANPIYERLDVEGRVVAGEPEGSAPSDVLHLEVDGHRYRLTGPRADELRDWVGTPVVAGGYVKVAGEFEVHNFVDLKEDTLELVVMSQCPFAKRAEAALIPYLRDWDREAPRPELDVRYLFQKVEGEGGPRFTSLHGEEEIRENLVQILLREDHPEVFEEYLMRRVESDAPWPILAKEVGLSDGDVELIRTQLDAEREMLIAREHDYLTERYGLVHASPTYVWESRVVPGLDAIDAFDGLDFSNGVCGRRP